MAKRKPRGDEPRDSARSVAPIEEVHIESQMVPALRRTIGLEIDADLMANRAEGDDRLPVVVSSEVPVFQPELGAMEILDHSPESVDLSRFDRGIALMAVMRGLGLDHGYDGNAVQVGVLEDPKLGADRRLRAMARFSKSAVAQEVRQDVLDGIRNYVSPGYRISKIRQEQTPDGKRAMRAIRWMPFETTIVPAPADPGATIGRSAGGDALPVEIESPASMTTAPKAKENSVSDKSTTAADNGAAEVDVDDTGTRNNTVVAVRDRSEESVSYADIANAAQIHGMTDQVAQWQSEGKQPREMLRAIADEVRKRQRDGVVIKPRVDLNEKEQKQYSMARGILSAAEGFDCFERDVSQDIAKNLPQGYKPQGGFFMPTTIGTRAGLDSKTSTTGTELKFVEPGSFIDLLRNKARVMQLGATSLTGLNSPVTFPVQNGAGTATWVAENPGSDVSDSNVTFTTRSLTAKTLQSSTSFSRQLLRQAVIDVENLVRNDLAQIHALAIDLAAINGAGTNAPTGILSNTSVGVYTLGTNGGAPTYAGLIGLEFTVENANANVGPMGYLTTPGIKATLKNTAVLTNTAGIAVWTGGEVGAANGYPAYSSKQVPSNITKGTSTTVCHAILFGVWNQLYIGEWGALEIITDPYRLKKQGMIEVTSFQMADIMLRYPEAFAVTKDALSSF